ncbi:putative secreted protein (Por secretion system target) [Flavobacteriaceae bacterium MAR_2010_105]|nr:putative secreted protein (Por secretion system target) [Flavobacteriaceae bacterium MAR_2010_105]
MNKILCFMALSCAIFTAKAQCDETLPIIERFDTNVINVCWNVVDKDKDGNNWYWWEYSSYYGGHKVIASNSFYTSSGALTPDNWIVSHAINLTSFSPNDNIVVSYKIRAELAAFAHEFYTVYAATSNQTSAFESSSVKRGEYIDEVGGAGTFVTRTLNISALAGNVVYIAFRHHNSYNQYNINIDEVSISSRGAPQNCTSDADNDGVCDSDDQCPGLNDALIGTPCNDGDPCTVNDVYDTDCGCSGTYADTDNDGVCDAYDQCPGQDDSIDTNNNGIPDGCEDLNTCTQQTTNFNQDQLNHSGSGESTISLALPSGSKDLSFTINNIDEKTKGKESNKYVENVTVTFRDGLGALKTYRSYSGLNVSSANVNIQGEVQSVTVSLKDSYDGNSDSTLNINFSSVIYCGNGSTPPPCTDSDGDTICDSVDQCPGQDDRIDANNNGIPDGCESSGCTESTSNFSKNPLTHSGSGSNSTTLNLPTNSQDILFTVSGLDDRLKGKESNKYIENVTVTYKDGLGITKTYGTFSGSNLSSQIVDIKGKVQSVTVSLTDGFNGNTTSNMSVDLSAVTYCSTSTARTSGELNTEKTSIGGEEESIESSIKVYPNPASDALYVKGISDEGSSNILLYNINGSLVLGAKIDNSYNQGQKIDIQKLPTGLYLMRIVNNNGEILKTERIVIK